MATATTDTDLTDALRARGQRVTPQRLLINRALHELDRHATAEEVLSRVSPHLPNASLPTVYATLDLLEELGMARRVRAGSRAVMYDPRAEPHHHMVCRNCGRVEDLEAELDSARVLRRAKRSGFKADSAELVVSGLCAKCAS